MSVFTLFLGGAPNSESEYVATEDLLSTGLYNTIEELWEAQRISQIKRLSETPNGRWLLERLQLATPGGILHQEPKQELTPTVRGKITVEKIPRNMNSKRNANRRRVRAQTISRIWSKKPGTLYADAAILPIGNTATLAVADPRGNVVRTASVYTTLAEHAEEAAIALAATGTKQDHITVITDSQRACRNFAKGEIGKPAARILSKAQFTSMKIVWAPGHAGVEGNEAANAAARAFHSNRDSSAPQPHTPDSNMKYNEYLKTIREARMTLPAPPSKFTKEEEHLYRRLQTGTMKTPMKLHQWYPQLHPSPTCSFCRWKGGDLYHLMWVCKHIKGLDPIPNPTRDSWNAALRWCDPGSQHCKWVPIRSTSLFSATKSKYFQGLGDKHQPIKARSVLFAAHGKCFQVSTAHKPAGATSFSFKVSTAYNQASTTSSFFLKVSSYEVTESAALTSVEDPSRVLRMQAGSAIYPVAVSSSLINPEAPSYAAMEGDLEAASPAEAVLVAFCL
ncbi:hypothetical protein HPB47_022860 [Ixodes persulcatus]|uniref:Uncharacterized protein n=1 Tax=Ixodes persulcatus TaxID=34615 RepID=A0AC60QBX7_IXOPE|nr:hypothetical protein HPB47_022860 [Ixodes persulcatus]